MYEAQARVLQKALEAVGRHLDRDIPLLHARVFLAIASSGESGLDQVTIQKDLDIGSGTASRITQSLGKVHYLKEKEGYDVVEKIDQRDMRQRVFRLTKKGVRCMAAVTEQLKMLK